MTLETTTLVFTDLVGSTELANRIGPGPADALRHEHFELLSDATVTARGRQVKNLGDGLMLAFPSANGALDAAVAMQRAIEARNRTADVRFQVRIGISLGEVTAEDGDYFGEPVVQAARLCALAEGGQILVTEMVRLMAGSTTERELSSIGAVELKGLPDPIVAHEVVWSPATGSTMSLPTRLRGAPDSAYVGRADERAALERCWARAAAGEGSLVLLAGEPGIGKTRLSSHHAFSVHAAGGTVLYGAVDEGLGVPYQPWIEALSHFVEHAPDGLLHRYVAEAGADLVRLVPVLERRVPDLPPLSRSDGETERYVLLDAATRLLRMASAANPVLVVLDDLHWADKQTLLLLTHLHRELIDSRVEFLVTFRDSDLTPGHDLTDTLALLRRIDRVERISLTGFDHDEIEDLLVQVSGQATTEALTELAAMLMRDTNGNPLFVGEVLRDLLEVGRIAQDADGIWGLTGPLDELSAPASVRDVVGQRVQRLGADATQVLATAAVIGRDFDLDLLAAVLDRTEDELLTVVEAGMAASLLTESGARTGSFRFIHALIAQALVDDQSVTRRAQLHRRIAGAIQELHGPVLGDRVASVARHILESGDDTEKAVDWARRAGQQAMASLAPDEALRWFQVALDLGPEDSGMRCDLLTDMGEATRDAGQPGYREVLLPAAQQGVRLRDSGRTARAVLAMDRGISGSLAQTDDELVAVLEAALRLCPDRDARRARLLGQLASEIALVDPVDRRHALVDEALDIARGIDDACLATVLASSLSALWAGPLMAERRALLAELRAIVPGVSDPQPAALAALHGVWIAIESADRALLEESIAALRAPSGAGARPSIRWFNLVVECVVAQLEGDFEEAERCAAEGQELSTAADLRDGFTVHAGLAMAIATPQGRLGDIAEIIEDVLEETPALGSGIRQILALAYVQAGRLDDARALLADALAEDPSTWVETNLWSSTVSSFGVVANRVRDAAAAAQLYPIALRVPDVMTMSGVGSVNHLSTVLGLIATTLGDKAAAVGHFVVADAALVGLGAPVLLAQNRYEHGRALIELGDPGDRDTARDLLERARDAYAAHDCPVRVAQCEELLATMS